MCIWKLRIQTMIPLKQPMLSTPLNFFTGPQVLLPLFTRCFPTYTKGSGIPVSSDLAGLCIHFKDVQTEAREHQVIVPGHVCGQGQRQDPKSSAQTSHPVDEGLDAITCWQNVHCVSGTGPGWRRHPWASSQG